MKDLEAAPEGTVIAISCMSCEGLEKHKKTSKDNWECLNCGYVETLNYNEEADQQEALNAEYEVSYPEVKPSFEIIGECSEEFVSVFNSTPDLRKADGEIVQLSRHMTEALEGRIDSGKTCNMEAIQKFIAEPEKKDK